MGGDIIEDSDRGGSGSILYAAVDPIIRTGRAESTTRTG